MIKKLSHFPEIIDCASPALRTNEFIFLKFYVNLLYQKKYFKKALFDLFWEKSLNQSAFLISFLPDVNFTIAIFAISKLNIAMCFLVC